MLAAATLLPPESIATLRPMSADAARDKNFGTECRRLASRAEFRVASTSSVYSADGGGNFQIQHSLRLLRATIAKPLVLIVRAIGFRQNLGANDSGNNAY